MPTAIVKAETCENCGRTIGKLETPQVWKEHVVCGTCHAHLAGTAIVSAARPTPSATGDVPPPPPHVLMMMAGSRRVQTIEATGKRWKGMQAIGSLALIGGLVVGGVGLNSGREDFVGLGLLLLIGGVALTVLARLGAWWYHG